MQLALGWHTPSVMPLYLAPGHPPPRLGTFRGAPKPHLASDAPLVGVPVTSRPTFLAAPPAGRRAQALAMIVSWTVCPAAPFAFALARFRLGGSAPASWEGLLVTSPLPPTFWNSPV